MAEPRMLGLAPLDPTYTESLMTHPRWLELAWADLGVAETPGPNHNARVVGYYADVGHPQVEDDETAWCAAFLGSCMERAGIQSTR